MQDTDSLEPPATANCCTCSIHAWALRLAAVVTEEAHTPLEPALPLAGLPPPRSPPPLLLLLVLGVTPDLLLLLLPTALPLGASFLGRLL